MKKLLLMLAMSTAGFCGQEYSSQSYDMPFESALKEAKGKDKEYHKMSGIDFVYVIAAKKCNRFNDLKRSFSRYNVFPYRFTAFSPKDISYDTMYRTCLHGGRRYKWLKANKLIVRGGKFVLDKRKMSSSKAGYIHRRMSIKSLSRSLSHISIIKDALDSGYEHIWIMDSATELRRDPNQLCYYLDRADKEIPDWTSIYTDFSERDYDDNLEPIGHFYGRPDVDFLEPDDYLVREEQNNDPYYDDSGEVDGMCYQNGLRGHQEWNNKLEEGELTQEQAVTGCDNDPSTRPPRQETRARASFVVENQRPTARNIVDTVGFEKFTHVGLLKGAHSYVLNRKGMKLIMDWYLDHKIYIPYAQEIQIIPGMHPYCTPEAITKNCNKG